MRSLGTVSIAFYLFCSLIGMGPMNIGFGILVLFWIARVARVRPALRTSLGRIPGIRGLGTTSLVLASACILSLLAMHFFPYSYAGHSPTLSLRAFEKLWYLLIPFTLVAAFVTHSPGSVDSFAFLRRIWWGTVLVLLPVAVIQFFTGWPKPQVIPTNPDHFHAILFLGHHLSVSSVLPFPTFAALAIALGTWRRTGRIDAFASVTGLAGLTILFLSYARTAWLAIPLGLILLFVRYLKPRTLLASLAGLVLVIGVASQTPAMKERIRNQMGVQDRFRLWEASLDYFSHRPLTGIGWLATQEMSGYYFQQKDPEHYREYFWGHAHSNVFEMLGGAGLLGLLAFLYYALFTIRFSWETGKIADRNRQYEWGDFSRGITVALILLHFNGLTNVTFWEGKVIHQQMIALGLLLVLRHLMVSQNKSPQTEP